MKKIIALLVFSICVTVSFAQSTSPIYTKPNNSYGTTSNRASIDSTLFFPTACGAPTDSTWLFSNQNNGHAEKKLKWAIYGDSCGGLVYVWNPHLKMWNVIGGSAAGVDTIYARGDSAFYKKQGTEIFAFILATGGTIDTTSLSNRIRADSLGVVDSASVLKVALTDSTAGVRIALVDTAAALRTTIAANFNTLNTAIGTKVTNSANASFLGSGTWAGKPSAASGTGFWYAQDSLEIWYSNGSTWIRITDPPNQIFHIYLRRKGQPGDSTIVTASDSTLYIAAIRDSGSFVHVINPDGSWTFFSSGSGGSIDTVNLSHRIDTLSGLVEHIINTPVYIANDTTLSGADSIGHAPDTTHLQLKRIKVYSSDGTIKVTPNVSLQAVKYDLHASTMPYYFLRDFGAKPDENDYYDVQTTAGSPNVTIPSGNFKSTDVGKYASISGAGVSGHRMKSAIFAVTDATHIVLANNASTTTTTQHIRYGTDNTVYIQNALDTLAASKYGGRLICELGNYLLPDTLVHRDNIGGDPNSLIYIPISTLGITGEIDSTSKTIVIQGGSPAGLTSGAAPLPVIGSITKGGSAFISDYDSTFNDSSYILSSARVNGPSIGFATLNSNLISVILEDVTFINHADPITGTVLGGVGFGYDLNPFFIRVNVFSDTDQASTINPTIATTGICGMYVNQGDISYFENTNVAGGYYNAYRFGEHTLAIEPLASQCVNAAALMRSSHPITILSPAFQWNIYNFSAAYPYDKIAGFGPSQGRIENARLEDYNLPGRWFQFVADIRDSINILNYNITYMKHYSSSGTPVYSLTTTSPNGQFAYNIQSAPMNVRQTPFEYFTPPGLTLPGSHSNVFNPAAYPRPGAMGFVHPGITSSADSDYSVWVLGAEQHGAGHLIGVYGAVNTALSGLQDVWRKNIISDPGGISSTYAREDVNFNGVMTTNNWAYGDRWIANVPIMSTGWTTTGRPSSPASSMLGWNLDSLKWEFYNGTVWAILGGSSGSGGSQDLNSVLTIGNTSPKSMSLTSYGGTAPMLNLSTTTHIQPLSYNNSFYMNNATFNGSAFHYDTTGFASWFQLVNGGFLFRGAPSGTAGGNIGTIYEFCSLNNDLSGGIGGNGTALGSTGYWLNWTTTGALSLGTTPPSGTPVANLAIDASNNIIITSVTKSGVFLPTSSNLTNVASITPDSAVYSVSGRIVHAKYSGTITASLASNTTQFSLTLPFSSVSINNAWVGSGSIIPSGNPILILGYAGMATSGTVTTVNFTYESASNSATHFVFEIDYQLY